MCHIVNFKLNDEMSKYTVRGWVSRAIHQHVYVMCHKEYKVLRGKRSSREFFVGH